MKKLLNPNCSEVIARLPVKNITEGKNLLKSIGLDILRMDPYLNMHILLPNGKEEEYNMITDPDNPNLPDFEHHSTFYLKRTDYDGNEGIYIQGHQHSQIQLYPTIKKIQDKLGIDFYGYDGGGDFEEIFESWLNEGAKNEDFQIAFKKEIIKLRESKIIKETAQNIFEVVDCVENKKHTKREKYILLKKAYEKYLNENKKELIKEKREDERYKNMLKNTSDEEVFNQIVSQAMFRYLDILFTSYTNKKIFEVIKK